jgi:transcription initiation factor TFIIIB Brf1 subunit/transcription initiation factor TFIIB
MNKMPMSDLWPTLHKPIAKKPIIELCDEGLGPTCSMCEDDEALEMGGSDIVCGRCGTIIDTPLEWSAEYRPYSTEQGAADPSRCGFPINHLMPQSSLGTIMLTYGSGRGSGSKTMNRIKRYHGWNQMPYRERKLWTVFDSLQIRATNSGISTAAIEEAKELYAQLTASASCRGQEQLDSMLAACLWESLKRHDTPRMPKDVAEIFQIPLRNVTRGIKQFQHTLAVRISSEKTDTYAGIKEGSKVSVATAAASSEEPDVVVKESDEDITARAHRRRAVWQKMVARTTTYEDFIDPFLTNLSISRTSALERMVRDVCQRTETHMVVPENTPPSLTASVIAFCCAHMKITIDIADIASVCGISAVTIQKCLKRLQAQKEKLLEE